MPLFENYYKKSKPAFSKFCISNFDTFNFTSGTRSWLQESQDDFNPGSTEPYFLFFQLTYTPEYAKYKSPKLLSCVKRSSNTFKLSSRPKCLCLRYVVAQCSDCGNFYSAFNTTKYWKSWEDPDMPKISIKLLEKKGIMMCTDCIWFYEGVEEMENSPH